MKALCLTTEKNSFSIPYQNDLSLTYFLFYNSFRPDVPIRSQRTRECLTLLTSIQDQPNGLVPSIDLETSDEAIKNRTIPFPNDLTTLGDAVDHLLADFNKQLDKAKADMAQLAAEKEAADKESARLNSELGDLEEKVHLYSLQCIHHSIE